MPLNPLSVIDDEAAVRTAVNFRVGLIPMFRTPCLYMSVLLHLPLMYEHRSGILRLVEPFGPRRFAIPPLRLRTGCDLLCDKLLRDDDRRTAFDR